MRWFDIIKDDDDGELTEEQIAEVTALFNEIMERIEREERGEFYIPDAEPFIENERLARIMAKYLVGLRIIDEEIQSKDIGLETHMFSFYYPELTFEALEMIDDLLDELQAANLLDEYNNSYDGIIPDVHALVNKIINTVAGDVARGSGYGYINKSSWFNTIKGVETATRSAELWLQKDEDLYMDAVKFIEHEIRGTYNTIKSVKESLAQELSERMAEIDGFMIELTEMQPYDGLVDIDWIKIADLFSEEISEAMEAYR
jgi:hypothetical protein